MDGTPIFAKAECVMLCIVHKKTRRIHELVVHLGIYAESLDGASIAKNVSEALMGSDDNGVPNLELKMKNWKATVINRAGTNKRAMDIVHEDNNVRPFSAYCVPHGTSCCGKEGEMTVRAAVVKHLTSMVKHRLCKARNVFSSAFKESARKMGGVRWGVYHEICEQINRIGPAYI